MLSLQERLYLRTDLGTGQQPSVGRLRFFIPPHRATAAFVPAAQLERGAEVVLELAPFPDVEVVHEPDQSGMFEAIVTEDLAHMGPVLLLDVGVVILAIGPAAGKGYLAPWPAGEVLIKRPVEELAAVVGVEAFQSKRCLVLDVPQVVQDGAGAFVPNRAQLGPAAVKVGKREGIDEIAGRGVATMRDGVGFDMTWRGGIRRTAAGGNAMAQEGARFGGRQASAWITHAHRPQQPVDLGRTDGQQLLTQRRR